jgi:hypothetical protein
VVFLDNSADNLAIFGEIARYVFTTIRITTDPQGGNNIISVLQRRDRVGGGREMNIRANGRKYIARPGRGAAKR